MADTIFHKIVAGEISCHKVYEDDRVLAFLDVFPIARGHTLVIPKVHAETLDQLDEAYAAAIGRVLPKISQAVTRAVGVSDYNILQNNGAAAHQAVMWVHFHIIPKHADGSGLGIGWNATKLGDAEAAELRTRIAGNL